MRRLAISFIAAAICVSPVHAREILDMAGKTVAVPDRVNKVFSGSPALTYMIYALDAELLSGLNVRIRDEDKQYLNKKILGLPVLGGFYGQGNIANTEMVLKTDPDLIILWADKNSALSNETEGLMMKNLPIPAVNVVFEDIDDYGDAFLFLGNLLGREERGRILKQYADETLRAVRETVESIPEDIRPTIYYAEGTDGLNTECDASWHAELINIAGARNVYHCDPRDTYGMEKINIEQVIRYNPDVIIAQEKAFFDVVFTDPRWQGIKAVRTGRVYLAPNTPFSWFDRPPSFMRLMGIQWLMRNLYPEQYYCNIVDRAKEFYSLFLSVGKTDEEIRKVVYP